MLNTVPVFARMIGASSADPQARQDILSALGSASGQLSGLPSNRREKAAETLERKLFRLPKDFVVLSTRQRSGCRLSGMYSRFVWYDQRTNVLILALFGLRDTGVFEDNLDDFLTEAKYRAARPTGSPTIFLCLKWEAIELRTSHIMRGKLVIPTADEEVERFAHWTLTFPAELRNRLLRA